MTDILDIAGVMAAFDLAWGEEVEEIDRAFDESIDADLYTWPRLTRRQNGTTASSPRNIVDTGNLKRSQNKNIISAEEIEWEWGADYAELNHNGGMSTYNGIPYYHTPRPWTQYAIAGDSSAPIEYQRGDAILNVPIDFAHRFDRHLAATLQD